MVGAHFFMVNLIVLTTEIFNFSGAIQQGRRQCKITA
jgi:hypothetical protein